jgi:hypothetical protein
MKTTLLHRKEKRDTLGCTRSPESQTDRSSRNTEIVKGARNFSDKENHRRESWARFWATSGAAAWATIAVLAKMGIARIGQIELLFLFAPLVIVPLGMELGRAIAISNVFRSGQSSLGRAFLEAAQRLQPIGAAFVVWAMCLPPGRKAGAWAAAWGLFCTLMALGGLLSLFRLRGVTNWRICLALALGQIDLVVGGAWLMASRLGMRPMGIQEPIGLLTAVHFHYAGFATATIAAAMLKSSTSQLEQGHGKNLWLGRIVLAIVSLPYLVAIGFVISPVLKVSAAVLFSVAVVTLAVFLRTLSPRSENVAARSLLQIASAAIFAGMLFSCAYAVADFLGSDVLTIPEMAKTHGLLNAMGFCLCGLLGWLVDAQDAEKSPSRFHG